MSRYVFDVMRPAVGIAGSERLFPLHRIYCVGQNYVAHTREMGGNPEREPPFFFMKPSNSVAASGSTVTYPPRTKNLHHEIELVVAIGKAGKEIELSKAEEHIFGYAAGIDLTRRDLQNEAKEKRRPWETGKVFEQAAPITAVHRVQEVGHPSAGRIWLAVNGDVRQDGDIGEMIWKVPETIVELSNLFTLAPGDLIFTGTPAGVGPVSRGDHINGGIEGVDEITIDIG